MGFFLSFSLHGLSVKSHWLVPSCCKPHSFVMAAFAFVPSANYLLVFLLKSILTLVPCSVSHVYQSPRRPPPDGSTAPPGTVEVVRGTAAWGAREARPCGPRSGTTAANPVVPPADHMAPPRDPR